MKTKCRVRFANGEVAEMLIRGAAKIGDRVRSTGSSAIAVVVEVIGIVE